MQRTSNYQLPQWEKEDRILMEDFNGAMANIENAIDGAKSEAAAAVESAKSEVTKEIETIRSSAYSPTNKPIAASRYVGTGNRQSITVGFAPTLVMIVPLTSDRMTGDSMTVHTAKSSGSDYVTLTSTGFELAAQSPGSAYSVNVGSTVYYYIAIR